MHRGKIFCGQWLLLSILLLNIPGLIWAEDSNLGKDIMSLAPLIEEALHNNPELVAEHAQVEGTDSLNISICLFLGKGAGEGFPEITGPRTLELCAACRLRVICPRPYSRGHSSGHPARGI